LLMAARGFTCKEGLLLKEEPKLGKWKKRWMVLRVNERGDPSLYYYKVDDYINECMPLGFVIPSCCTLFEYPSISLFVAFFIFFLATFVRSHTCTLYTTNLTPSPKIRSGALIACSPHHMSRTHSCNIFATYSTNHPANFHQFHALLYCFYIL